MAMQSKLDRFRKAAGLEKDWWESTQRNFVAKSESALNRGGGMVKTAVQRYKSTASSIGAFGRVVSTPTRFVGGGVSRMGQSLMDLGAKAPTNVPSYSPLSLRARAATGTLSRKVGRLTRGIGNTIQRPSKALGSVVSKGPKAMVRGAKAFRRGIKAIPKPIRRMGMVGGVALGLTAMLGVSVLKGAMNQGQQTAYDRYMRDQATLQGTLGSTRVGNASGTNRMLGYGGTVGLSNALSKTRHGRY